jgi:hypothetical protein
VWDCTQLSRIESATRMSLRSIRYALNTGAI